MVDSITKTLGAGSGIDVTALVDSLVTNQFAFKSQQLTTRAEAITAQLSSVAKLKSGITGFSTALQSLVRGGTLATQPTSANTGIVKASALPGARVAGLSATVEVRALASAQVSHMLTPLAAGAAVGTGSFTITTGGTTSEPIVIAAGDDTLAKIAAKINAAKSGVTASVVSDAGGERLVMKGATGAANAFSVAVTEDPASPGLGQIAVGGGATGTTNASTAVDAVVAVDGVEVRRASNTISDLMPGVRLELQRVEVGTKVALGATPAIENLRQAVNDVVATFNELNAVLKEATDPVSGPLRADPAARELMTQLRKLTLTDLTGATDGSPKTLAEIGVGTNRDGTLRLDANRLTDALTRFPTAIEAIFAEGAGQSGKGLSAALSFISVSLTNQKVGLGASEALYVNRQKQLTTQQDKITADSVTARTRLTQQYASMDARVAAYRSTQTFLEQQVAAWNRD